MNDQTKLALFDSLIAYLIQSSSAMDGTIKALATGALVSPLVLNEAIDSAKVLLSKVVIHPFLNDRSLLLIIVMGNLERRSWRGRRRIKCKPSTLDLKAAP
jgi:hypothetical protein